MSTPHGFKAKIYDAKTGALVEVDDPQLLLDILTRTGTKRRYLTCARTRSARLTRVGGRPGVGIPHPEDDATTWKTGRTIEVPGQPEGNLYQVWSHGRHADEYWLTGVDADGNLERPILANRKTGAVLDTWEAKDSELSLRYRGRMPLRARELVDVGFDLDSTLIHRISGDRFRVADILRNGSPIHVALIDKDGVRDVSPLPYVKRTYRPDGPPQVGMRVTSRITRRSSVVHEVRHDGRIALVTGQYYDDAASFWGSWQ